MPSKFSTCSRFFTAIAWPESIRLQTGRPISGKLGASGRLALTSVSRFLAVLAPVQRRWRQWLNLTVVLPVLLLALYGPAAPALATGVDALPDQAPANHVLDAGDVLSRATLNDVSHALEALEQQGVNASWVSIPRLDYGISLGAFGEQLLQRWQGSGAAQLLFLLDAQTSATQVVASADLQERLSPELLRSTARTTMAQPLRDGNRYRQASLDGISRLAAVLDGQSDPGEPSEAMNPVNTARVPSREQTRDSNALTWVAVLLVVGTIVPMLTWWVFSR